MMKTKNLFLILVAVLMVAMTVYSAAALEAPKAKNPFGSGGLFKAMPLAVEGNDIIFTGPSGLDTSSAGECTPYGVKDEYCNGEVRHYTQCIMTASGGLWQPNSEICGDYGADVKCVGGQCVKQEDILISVLVMLGIVFVLVLTWKLILKKK